MFYESFYFYIITGLQFICRRLDSQVVSDLDGNEVAGSNTAGGKYLYDENGCWSSGHGCFTCI